jgi:hypothetical protein
VRRPQEYDDVAIASQMTIDRLPVLESMAESWAGPISAVVLLSNPEAELKQIHSLRNRSAVIRKNVDFHLVHGEEVRVPHRVWWFMAWALMAAYTLMATA